MKVKSGIDIIEINRIQNSIEELGDKFLKKIYTDEEIKYCENTKNMKYQHYAARFAAKEAIFKAVSDLLDDKYSISWKNAQIKNDKNGKPHIELINLDKRVEEQLKNIKDMDVSISHIKDCAIAVVTILCS